MEHKRNLEQGQGFVEYLLVLVIIALIILVAVALFGDSLAALKPSRQNTRSYIQWFYALIFWYSD